MQEENSGCRLQKPQPPPATRRPPGRPPKPLVLRNRRRYQRHHQHLQQQQHIAMSTGKRLAKRSIVGTRVCAPGDDGKYYSGDISDVYTPAPPPAPHRQTEAAGLIINPYTRFTVMFDPVPPGAGQPPDDSTEFAGKDLVGLGYRNVSEVKLVPGQRVYLTYNGREIEGEVTEHKEGQVDVVIAPNGKEVCITVALPIFCVFACVDCAGMPVVSFRRPGSSFRVFLPGQG